MGGTLDAMELYSGAPKTAHERYSNSIKLDTTKPIILFCEIVLLHFNTLTLCYRNFVMTNNRLIGGVRFRQVRAAPNKGCKVPDDLKSIAETCYAFGYSSFNKDTAPFGPAHDPHR